MRIPSPRRSSLTSLRRFPLSCGRTGTGRFAGWAFRRASSTPSFASMVLTLLGRAVCRRGRCQSALLLGRYGRYMTR